MELIKKDYSTGNITVEEVKTLIQAGILPAGVPTSQVQVFAAVCRERGLSPFSKEIYLVGYKGKDGRMNYSTIVGIDGWRKMAKKSPETVDKRPAALWFGGLSGTAARTMR